MAQIKNKLTLGEKLKYAEKRGNSIDIDDCGNLAKLLLQGFKRIDQSTIRTILCIEEDVIKRSVQRLRNDVIEELIKELSNYMQKNTILNSSASLWLKHLLQTNATYLMSKPNIPDLLNPITDILERRITFQNSLRGLQGNIQFILNHIDRRKTDVVEEEEILISNGDLSYSSSEEFDFNESPKEDSSDEEDEDMYTTK